MFPLLLKELIIIFLFDSNFMYFCVLDHSPLLEDEGKKERKEGEWAIRIAQHLLSKLSVHRSYVIAPYPGCEFEDTCPCPLHDNLVGSTGDTSLGM